MLHLVFCRDEPAMRLVRHPGDDWRALQDAYPDYAASLAYRDVEELLEHLADEWPNELARVGADAIRAFAAGDAKELALWPDVTA